MGIPATCTGRMADAAATATCGRIGGVLGCKLVAVAAVRGRLTLWRWPVRRPTMGSKAKAVHRHAQGLLRRAPDVEPCVDRLPRDAHLTRPLRHRLRAPPGREIAATSAVVVLLLPR